MKIDTHMHSKASDGLWTPSQVVVEAKNRGLDVIALTDHDSIQGLREAMEIGSVLDIRVVTGIEIDAVYDCGDVKVRDLELLGLGFEIPLMQDFALSRAKARMDAMDGYCKAYNEYILGEGFSRNATMKYSLVDPKPLCVADVINHRNNKLHYDNPHPFISKPDLLEVILTRYGADRDCIRGAIASGRKESRECKAEYSFLWVGNAKKPTFYEAIDAVHRAGGKAVIAHPGLSVGYKGGMKKGWEEPRAKWLEANGEFSSLSFIIDLAKHGLDGIEMYFYSGNDPDHADKEGLINEYFAVVAKHLGLFVTYGSDCHGPKGNGPRMGKWYGAEIHL